MTDSELNIECINGLLDDFISGRLSRGQIIELIELLYL